MADREEIRVPELGTPISHYTDAVRAGDLLFVSGCVPTDAEGNVVGGDDVAAQARKTLENIGVILERAGATFADVVKTTIFLVDIGDFTAVNAVYATFMPEPPPARSTIGVAALPKGGLVEIEAMARRASR